MSPFPLLRMSCIALPDQIASCHLVPVFSPSAMLGGCGLLPGLVHGYIPWLRDLHILAVPRCLSYVVSGAYAAFLRLDFGHHQLPLLYLIVHGKVLPQRLVLMHSSATLAMVERFWDLDLFALSVLGEE